MIKFIDLTGKKFGKLTVLGRTEQRKDSAGRTIMYWYCVCDCQKNLPEEEREIIAVRGRNLRDGKTISCGCYRREWNKKENRYEIDGNIVRMYDCRDKMFIIDLDDLDKVIQHRWRVDDEGYVHSNFAMIDGKAPVIALHRFVMNCSDKNFDVDHINHNPCDNRKDNLRICTHLQNMHNLKPRKNNKAGVSGIQFDSSSKRYIATIGVNMEKIYLGCYESLEDAIKVRKEAEAKYYKGFGYSK